MKRQRERGAILMLTAFVLPLAIGVCGLALELSMALQRQGQLQQVADAVALSAAQQLDGTASGVSGALVAAGAAVLNRRVRGVDRVVLNPAVLSFAADPAGPWLDVSAAQAAPGGLRYARADMAGQGAAFTVLPVAFGRFLGGSDATMVGARAVAGPNGLRVLPLAICAPSSVASATRFNGAGLDERIDYGLRHGLTYNLLALNPAPEPAAASTSWSILPARPAASRCRPAAATRRWRRSCASASWHTPRWPAPFTCAAMPASGCGSSSIRASEFTAAAMPAIPTPRRRTAMCSSTAARWRTG